VLEAELLEEPGDERGREVGWALEELGERPLQPTIAAGCIVRTTNKYFDFSLRQDFTDKRELLLKQIAGNETQKAAL